MTFVQIGTLARTVLRKAELRAARQDTAANGEAARPEGSMDEPPIAATGEEAGARMGKKSATRTRENTPPSRVVRREERGLRLVSSRDGRAAMPRRAEGRFAPSAARQPLVLVVDNHAALATISAARR